MKIIKSITYNGQEFVDFCLIRGGQSFVTPPQYKEPAFALVVKAPRNTLSRIKLVMSGTCNDWFMPVRRSDCIVNYR